MKQKQLIIKKQAVKRKNNWNFFPRNACKLNKSHYLCTRNQEITDLQIRIDSLAQQVEHNTFNVGVLGSSPRRITENKIKPLIFRGFSSYPKALFPFYSPLNMNNRKNYIVYLQQSAMKQECQDPKQRYKKKIIQTYSTDRN